MSSKSVSEIFKILFQTWVLIFLSFVASLLVDRYVQLKSSSSDEKYISGEIRDTL